MRILGLLLCCMTIGLEIQADVLFMADGNVVEIVYVGTETKKDRTGRDMVMVVGTDQAGNKREFLMSDIKQVIKGKTTWELQQENLKWYEKSKAGLGNTWTDHQNLAKRCQEKKLYSEAADHFKQAYEIRAAVPMPGVSEEERYRTLGKWLANELDMPEEAQSEYIKVYELTKEKNKTAEDHAVLARWCVAVELMEQADEQYKLALSKAASDQKLAAEYKKFELSRAVPLNHAMLRALQPNLQVACRFLKSKLQSDGSIGSDIEMAGIQAIRAMTAMSIEALLAEHDIGYAEDNVKFANASKEIEKGLERILSMKKGTGRFMGPDIWGPTQSLQCLLRAMSRPYLNESLRREVIATIPKIIKEIEDLQHKDGGYKYYDFVPVSSSFLSAAILLNLTAARNYGFKVDEQKLVKTREFIESTKYGLGTYMYSPALFMEGGANTSFSPVGASARSPLCELACLAGGKGDMKSMSTAMINFGLNQPILDKLRGRMVTHVGKGRTAPYYFMFGHYWAARASHRLPHGFYHQIANWMRNAIYQCQDRTTGAFFDFKGPFEYQVYATSLGVLAMYALISEEADPAFSSPAFRPLQWAGQK